MSKKSKPPFPIKDDADRAMARVHAAVCELIEIAGAHPDPKLAMKAATDLQRLGNLATVPLREAIDRFPAEERRAMLVSLLGCVDPMTDMASVIRLSEIMATDPSQWVRKVATETLALHHERVRRQREARAAREGGGQEARVEAGGVAAG